MALSDDIYTILRANANVINTFATRIYPCIAPANPTYPYIVYTLNSIDPKPSKTYGNEWDECYVTISVVYIKLPEAETYANYVRTAMNRYQGTISSDKVKGVSMQTMSWEPIPIMEDGVTDGLAVFAVNAQYKIQVAQNITE